MASLKKNGRFYYIVFSKVVGGKRLWSTKSLGITHKDMAEKAQELLEHKEARGEIDPYSEYFDPQQILEEERMAKQMHKELMAINTLRKAADYFYQKKKHLSDRTVNLKGKNSNNWGAYQRAVEHFISVNKIEDLHPRAVQLYHFENIIFKDDIKATTRRFYYRQLRVFWNFLRKREIVKKDYFKLIRGDLPEAKQTARSKMINEEELHKIFTVFDQELKRKKEIPEFSKDLIQLWFKPMMATYFYGGFRRSEVGFDGQLQYSGLKGENLEYIDGQLEMIYLPATKGRKERLVPISRELKKYLLPYLERRGPIGHDHYVFIYNGGSKKGWPVTGARAYREFKKYADLAGLPASRTIHGMRHRRVTTWLEDGYSLKEGQYMAGHSTARVTEEYTHLLGRNLLSKQRELDRRKNGQ